MPGDWNLFEKCAKPGLSKNFNKGTKFDYKSVDGVHGIQTRDSRMIGTDESTEHCAASRTGYLLTKEKQESTYIQIVTTYILYLYTHCTYIHIVTTYILYLHTYCNYIHIVPTYIL